MSKSAIYAVNTSSQAIPLNGTINFGNIIRKFGCNCRLEAGSIVTNGTGYYDVITNISFGGTTAGDVVIGLYKDGTLIPGAIATATVADATDYSVTIPAIIRDTCPCGSTITSVVTGVPITVTNATIAVEKI